jgi:SAM-dependent methyltransferase
MTDNPVEAHYTSGTLGEAILAALKAAGKDLDHLTPDDLVPVDEFHGGQRPATIRLADLVGFTGTERVLDVGSGLGGPSRFLTWRYGCQVSGVDLTAEFVRVAETLTQLTGLVGRVDYRQGSPLDLPFEDMSFDVAWSQNVAMNIADSMPRCTACSNPVASSACRRSPRGQAVRRTTRCSGRARQASAFSIRNRRPVRSSKWPGSASSSGRIRQRRHWHRRWRGRAAPSARRRY